MKEFSPWRKKKVGLSFERWRCFWASSGVKWKGGKGKERRE